ncbi:MAG: cytochrome-c peroxidase [Bacillota bacterium]
MKFMFRSMLVFFSCCSLYANDGELRQTALNLFGVIPQKSAAVDNITAEKIELGRKLFFDYRLSKDGSTACVRCHQPQYYSTDRLSRSMGFNNNKGDRNAQSILNLQYQTIVHWRNDRSSIEEQAFKAFTSPLSLGNSSVAEAVKRLALAGYEPFFRKAFPGMKEPLSLENAASAIGFYERSLTTPGAFDKYLSGDKKALTEEAIKGLNEFITVGCAGCHNGPAIGGRSLQKFGVFQNYWNLTKSPNPDKGRQAVTNKDEDLYMFKVPSLRNVSETAPYFHDGSAKDLPTAIRWMGKLQLNKDLSETQVQQIKAFLESLKGELPRNYREAVQMTSEPHVPEVFF